MLEIVNSIGQFLSDYVLVVLLLIMAIYFTIVSRGVQFRYIGEMVRLLARSGSKNDYLQQGETKSHSISSFQAFSVSMAGLFCAMRICG